MTRLHAILFVLCVLACSGHAAEPFSARETVYSQSGQFVIAGNRLAPASAMIYGVDTNWSRLVPVGRQAGPSVLVHDANELEAGASPMVTLGPTYLAASAERIRQAIYDQLEILEDHRGTVYITLLRPTNPPQEILVMHMRNKRGGVWDYKLEIPNEVRSDHLLRALTHVILLEIANRHGLPRLAEVPLWLREGLIEHLKVTVMKSAFFDQEKRVSVVGRLNEEISNLKREINGQELLALDQLSWPGTLKSGPKTERQFRLSSHGIVAELLQLSGGGQYLGQSIRMLSDYQNWQFAFLAAFGNYFGTLLDFEKWWAVTSLGLSGGEEKMRQLIEGDLVFKTLLNLERWQRLTMFQLGNSQANQEWSIEDSYLRLNKILQVPIEWQAGEEGDISREEIKVHNILTSMEFSFQQPVIEQLIARLFGLQLHSPPEVAGLVRDYRLALEKYLVEREAWYNVDRFGFERGPSPMVTTRQTVRKLGELDLRRENLEQQFGAEEIPIAEQIVLISDEPDALRESLEQQAVENQLPTTQPIRGFRPLGPLP